jgi:uncharacterized membrane protein YeaQ/YmgE (transglycosylase-associated protein family)
MQFLWYVLTGLLCGLLTGQVFKSNGIGFIGNSLIGIMGSIEGGWVTAKLFANSTLTWQLIAAAAIANLLLFVINCIKQSNLSAKKNLYKTPLYND